MSVIDQQSIQVFPTNSQLMVGGKGPLAARLIMDFTQTSEYDLDMQNFQSLNQFDLCQTIFVDNANGGAPVSILIPSSGQLIVVKNGTQGYFNVICPNPIRMIFTCAGGQIVTVFLINTAVPGASWSAI